MSALFPAIEYFPLLQSDIDQGKPDNCQECPLALAFTRALPDWFVLVDYEGLHLEHKTIPYKLRNFHFSQPEGGLHEMMTQFDYRSVPMQPGVLLLNCDDNTIGWRFEP